MHRRLWVDKSLLNVPLSVHVHMCLQGSEKVCVLFKWQVI